MQKSTGANDHNSLQKDEEIWEGQSDDEELASQDALLLGKPVLKSKTLRWHMPIIGEVPLMFYVPENGEEFEQLKYLIEEHGG